MGRIVNELSWSVSRAALFQSCQRAYYYRYYGYWGAWENGAGPEKKLLHILRNIKPMVLWAGSIVHDVISASLLECKATGRAPELGNLQERATSMLRKGWLESVNREWEKAPSKCTNLFELYYGDGENYGECKRLPREQTDQIKLRVMDALEAFAHSPALRDILQAPKENWMTIDNKESYFMMDGIKVWAIIDFAYIDADGTMHIIDWKTGREHSSQLRFQLACYALYAMDAWNVPLDRIAVHGVLLNDGGRRSDHAVDQALLDSVKGQIRASYEAMKGKISDPDANLVDEEDCPCNPSDMNCSSCPFIRVCPGVSQVMG